MTATTTRRRREFWALRDLPVVGWLLAVLIAALIHPLVPVPRWLMIHLLLLGAVSHAILVWSRHFTDALLHSPSRPGDRREQSRRLAILNLGVVAVVVGVLGGIWMITVAGATGVGVAVIWHGVSLAQRLRKALPGRFAVTVRYYLTAACCLPVGAGLGTALARGLGDPLQDQLKFAHAMINLLGWVGLTVIGTLVTLWPTMLRTKIADGAERAARRALPVLTASLVIIVGGASAGVQYLAAGGLLGHLAGLTVIGVPLLETARRKRPASYPTWSVMAGLLWLAGCLLALLIAVGTVPSWAAIGPWFDWLTPFLAAGFGAQVLIGALSYLVPMALSRGPSSVRAANAAIDRGAPLRIVMINGGLLLCALPVPDLVRVAASVLALGGLAAFLPLLFLAIRAAHAEGPAHDTRRPGRQLAGFAAVGLAAVVLSVSVGVALDPAASRTNHSASAGVVSTGRTTTARIEAKDMRFTPATIMVRRGDRLIIVVTNTDHGTVHDLVLETGAATGRLQPGRTGRVVVPVVGRNLKGWCSVVGHRQMGMVLHIVVTGGTSHTPQQPVGDDHSPGDHSSTAGTDAALDFQKAPSRGFVAHDATLPPLSQARVHRLTLTVEEVDREVAPGVTQRLWTFNGSMPGPILHGRLGDVFVITLVNHGSMGHSIDFHAGSVAPDRPMRTIAPGESLVYRFRADRAGIWMYHCASMPMSAHIANGLFGAVIIDPPDLDQVERSYVLLQSELYLGAQGGPVDVAKLQAERPDAAVFNGYVNQYDHRPLAAKPGERIRIWVLDAGPNCSMSFHVVGARFDTVYSEGGYLLRRSSEGGSQSLALAPAQGGFVELTFPEPGHYPFITHVMVDAERGAHGIVSVTR
jgi:nitrite reductase (NO-forming)